MLAKSKFSSIEMLISQVLIDIDISHEKYITFFKEKHRYERIKENIRDKNENKKKNLKNEQYEIKKLNVIKKLFFFLVYIKMLEITRKKLL